MHTNFNYFDYTENENRISSNPSASLVNWWADILDPNHEAVRYLLYLGSLHICSFHTITSSVHLQMTFHSMRVTENRARHCRQISVPLEMCPNQCIPLSLICCDKIFFDPWPSNWFPNRALLTPSHPNTHAIAIGFINTHVWNCNQSFPSNLFANLTSCCALASLGIRQNEFGYHNLLFLNVLCGIIRKTEKGAPKIRMTF